MPSSPAGNIFWSSPKKELKSRTGCELDRLCETFWAALTPVPTTVSPFTTSSVAVTVGGSLSKSLMIRPPLLGTTPMSSSSECTPTVPSLNINLVLIFTPAPILVPFTMNCSSLVSPLLSHTSILPDFASYRHDSTLKVNFLPAAVPEPDLQATTCLVSDPLQTRRLLRREGAGGVGCEAWSSPVALNLESVPGPVLQLGHLTAAVPSRVNLPPFVAVFVGDAHVDLRARGHPAHSEGVRQSRDQAELQAGNQAPH
eukprot:CAMPEP_0197554504 /NCGR_PEP_ID=MMETSP1320-20131121/11469_1 /TAXON_ID=91990 /ORGANISM="Bolidomonas sp., Strain RCC2347" /LENGTH=255 /DNA_ID=CAMNT_0043115391 /DNA_START=138 /DNA_END=901 /DNA_ORIENTATION=-